MSGDESPDTDPDGSAPPVYRPSEAPEPEPVDTTTAILGRARTLLVAHPRALAALVLAGGLVAGIDWIQLHDAVPTTGYEGIQQGRIAATFRLVPAPESRANVPPNALVDLRPIWLVRTVGLVLAKFLAVVLAGGYALATLLDGDLSAAALVRYGAVVAALWLFFTRITFEGGAVLIGFPLVIAFLFVAVRLVPLPARLLRREGFRTALDRSWRQARGHGWELFGAVVLVGLANHLAASVPVVGPVVSGAVVAVHAAVAVVACESWPVPERDGPGDASAAVPD